MNVSILDNPVWHSMISGNQQLAQGNDKAKYFDRSVSPFAGIPELTGEYLYKLKETVPFDEPVGLFTTIENFNTEPWILMRRIDGFQMMYNKQEVAEPEVDIKHLTNEHVPQMVTLTALTNPGPFSTQTILFGGYHGIFEGDRLVAMAGNRFHAGSFVEISAVCTHPDFLGRGYARNLILNQIHHIQNRSCLAYLHVREENTRAISLYKSIGFEIRTQMHIHLLQKKV